jgi:putative endonuclease
MDTLDKQQKGQLAERKACDYLQAKGFILLVQNYRCFHGEIDLIMQDQDDIVFVEVRSRSRVDYGNALESVNKTKRKKLIKAATYFLQKQQCLYKINSRFDIVAIHPVNGKMQLEWFKNAFSVER